MERSVHSTPYIVARYLIPQQMVTLYRLSTTTHASLPPCAGPRHADGRLSRNRSPNPTGWGACVRAYGCTCPTLSRTTRGKKERNVRSIIFLIHL